MKKRKEKHYKAEKGRQYQQSKSEGYSNEFRKY